jgi:PAS domain S-box-containing protein
MNELRHDGGEGMNKCVALCLLGAAAFGLLVFLASRTPLFSANYLPHRFCYLAQPGLIWSNVTMDALIAISYVAIFLALLWIAMRLRSVPALRGYLWIFISFGLFIVACAATHAMEIVTVWWPLYPLSAGFKVLCVATSVPTAILFARAAPALRRNAVVQLQWLNAAEAQRDVALRALQLSEHQIARMIRTEAELEADNRYLESFRLMIDAVEDYAVFMLDPQGLVTTWNSGAERINGYRREEIVGRHFSIFYTAAQIADGLPERELIAARTNGRSEDEGFRVRKDGTLVWANVILSPLRGPDGKLVGFGEVTRDLTERRRTEQALHEFNKQLNEVFECTSDSIMTIDKNWSIVYGNSKAIRSLPDLQLGHNYWQCFPAVRGTRAEQQLLHAMNSRVEGAYEIFYEPYKSWFRARIFPSGSAGITIFFSNITHEMKVEDELLSYQLQREERIEELSQLTGELNSVMDSTSNGILKLDSAWRIRYGNRVSMESLPDFKLHADFWDCFPALHGTLAERQIRLSMRDRVETQYDLLYVPYDRSYKVHVYPDGDGVSLFFSDITVERKLEEQLTHERLLREKRIEALSHMAGGLAHEISNPLAIIHGRASDLRYIAGMMPAVPAQEVDQACDSTVSSTPPTAPSRSSAGSADSPARPATTPWNGRRSGTL